MNDHRPTYLYTKSDQRRHIFCLVAASPQQDKTIMTYYLSDLLLHGRFNPLGAIEFHIVALLHIGETFDH